jgi:hypothetical protein
MSDEQYIQHGMTGDQIERVFGALARIEQKIESYDQRLTLHADEDKLMAADIRKLQLSNEKQKGVLAGIATIGSVVGAGVGYAIELFHRP